MTPEELKKINLLLTKAKITMMAMPDLTFFTTILFSMKFIWDEKCNTAWTTGLKLGFSPKFFMWLKPEERVFVLAHECCHVAYMHIGRLGSRDHNLFNQAADHVINLYLKSRGMSMPSVGLCDKRFEGMSTEQVYEVLKAEEAAGTPIPSNQMEDLRNPGEGEEGESSMKPEDLQRAMDDILVRAQVQSKMSNDKPGSIPGEIELYLDKLLNPKLPWQTILRQYLKAISKHDYSWKRPNRRFMPDHYLPSLHGEGAMSNFQAWVDISGSETDADFLRFISELNGILKIMKPKKIELGQFDTSIKSINVVRNIMELANVKFTGRGGTDITAVLDHIEATKPKVALIFSDGGFYHDRQTCPVNIIWMIHDNPTWTAPFGKVIYYNTHED